MSENLHTDAPAVAPAIAPAIASINPEDQTAKLVRPKRRWFGLSEASIPKSQSSQVVAEASVPRPQSSQVAAEAKSKPLSRKSTLHADESTQDKQEPLTRAESIAPAQDILPMESLVQAEASPHDQQAVDMGPQERPRDILDGEIKGDAGLLSQVVSSPGAFPVTPMEEPPMEEPPMKEPPMKEPPMKEPPMKEPPMKEPLMEKPSMEKPSMEETEQHDDNTAAILSHDSRPSVVSPRDEMTLEEPGREQDSSPATTILVPVATPDKREFSPVSRAETMRSSTSAPPLSNRVASSETTGRPLFQEVASDEIMTTLDSIAIQNSHESPSKDMPDLPPASAYEPQVDLLGSKPSSGRSGTDQLAADEPATDQPAADQLVSALTTEDPMPPHPSARNASVAVIPVLDLPVVAVLAEQVPKTRADTLSLPATASPGQESPQRGSPSGNGPSTGIPTKNLPSISVQDADQLIPTRATSVVPDAVQHEDPSEPSGPEIPDPLSANSPAADVPDQEVLQRRLTAPDVTLPNVPNTLPSSGMPLGSNPSRKQKVVHEIRKSILRRQVLQFMLGRELRKVTHSQLRSALGVAGAVKVPGG